MKKFLIVFLVFFVACSNGSEESSEAIESIETTTTTQETTTTTSSTTTMVEEEYEVDPPKVLITNCPTEDINADIYELEWTAEAGSGDIVYIGIFVEKDDANFTRVFFTKEDNADLITFPTAYTSNSYSYQIDNTDSNVAASYIIEINIISEQPNGDQISTYDLCFTNYSPPTTTTSTTTTTTTTIPYETLIEKCFLVEEVNIRMPQLIEFNFESNENLSINDSVNFSYKFIAGTYKINQIVIRYEDNYKNRNISKNMIDYSSEGLPLEGIIETDPNEVGFQNGFSYGINSVNIIDEKGNQIHYLNMGQITNRVNKYWCELNHSFFTTDMIFKIEN